VSRCKKRSKAAVTVRRQWMMIHFDFLSLTKLTGHSKKTSRPQMRERMEARKHRRIKKKRSVQERARGRECLYTLAI
jgi:hypothetical protein